MKHLFTLIILILLLPATALAHDFEVDGIYYNINGNEATVTFQGQYYNQYSDEYTGEVIIPEIVTYNGTQYNVTSIGSNAFTNCRRLSKIIIPSSITSISEGAFRACIGLNSIHVVSDNANYDSRNGCNAIIETASNSLIAGCMNTIIPSTVTSIGNNAFNGCTGLISMAIPNSVTSIGNNAFEECTGLTSVSFPNSLFSFGWYSFAGCSSLTSVTIPKSVTDIGFFTFTGCSGLASIIVDENNPIYDSRDNCNAIIFTSDNTLCVGCKNTVIPNSVTSVGNYAFYKCSGLSSITIPNSVTSFGNVAFSGCCGLSDINIPNSVTYIGSEAFSGCNRLTNVTIPNSVTTIGHFAFEYCSELISLTLPNSVTSIGHGVFSECSGLKSITVAYDNPKYDSRNNSNAIIETSSNTLITGCMNTVIPNSITSIGKYAFSGCSEMASVIIPNSIISIGNNAFEKCNKLNEVYVYIIDPSQINISYDVFDRYPTNFEQRTLYVPFSTLEAYQSDTKWSDYFGVIVEMDPVPTTSIELDKSTAIIIEGKTLQLTATVRPRNAINTVAWGSNNPDVATVSCDGLVTAHNPGTTMITATTTDGSNLSASCVVTVISPSANDRFYIEDFSIAASETRTINILLDNEVAYTAFQCDLYLPCGLTATNFALTDRKNSNHTFSVSTLPDGRLRLLSYSLKLKTYSGNNGALVTMDVTANEEFTGPAIITLCNTVFTTEDGVEVTFADEECTVQSLIMGDVNGDGNIDVNDVTALISKVLGNEVTPFNCTLADLNGDGKLDVSDITALITMVLARH